MVEETTTHYSNPLHNPYMNREVIVEIGLPRKKTKSNVFYTVSFSEAWIGWIKYDRCSLMLIFSGIGCCLLLIGIVFLIIWGVTELLNPE